MSAVMILTETKQVPNLYTRRNIMNHKHHYAMPEKQKCNFSKFSSQSLIFILVMKPIFCLLIGNVFSERENKAKDFPKVGKKQECFGKKNEK